MKEKLENIKEFILNHKQQCIIGGIAAIVVIVCAVVLLIHGLSGKKTTDANGDSTGKNGVTLEAATIGQDSADDPQKENNNLATEDGEGQEIQITTLSGSNSSYSNGIDVSKWQGKIDWTSVASSGIDFAMIRVGYRTDDKGTIVEDPYAAYNLQQAQAAGIKIGVYFFSTAISEDEAVEEALWTANFIAKYSITYPVVYNCEGYTESDSRMYSLSNAQRTNNALAFLDSITSSGYEGMMYASKSELEGNKYWNTSSISSKYAVWLASYGTSVYPDLEKPTYSGSCNMWQYTNKGVISGISGYVDFNVAYFSYDTVASPKDTSGTVVDADTAELGMTFTTVNDSMTAKEETNLRSEPNTSSSIVATITNGTYVTRTGTSDSGWSRVTYNGQTCYAYTQLLTTETVQQTTKASSVEDGITFTSVNETVTAKEETNLRNAPSFDGSIITSIKNGTTVTKTGEGDNGWSRVIYNGTTYYAVTSYLTSDLSATSATTSSASSNTSGTTTVSGMTFTAKSDYVTAKEETNLRTLPSTEGSTIVATIKNGEYVTRTATSDSGWSQLTYNGQTVYAITSYLMN